MDEGTNFLANLAMMSGGLKSEKPDRKVTIQRMIISAVSSVSSKEEATAIIDDIKGVCENMYDVIREMLWSE